MFAADFLDMARRAGESEEGDGAALVDVPAQLKEAVLRSNAHWTRSDAAAVWDRDVRQLYDDYLSLAEATGVTISAPTRDVELVAQRRPC